MTFVVFGLTISSSWGNGHATLWRGLASALARAGHALAFFERDVPYYARHRDLSSLPGGALHLYARWADALAPARRELARADCALVSSYCPDGIAATDLVLSSPAPVRAFYDMDTPVTLERARAGETVEYIGPRGLSEFDLVLSFTGGAALGELTRAFGARRVRPLYGSVDPDVHRPVQGEARYRADLSYLGTYAPNRQAALERFFLAPARLRPARTFVIGGSQYGAGFPWRENVNYVDHLPPSEHPSFFCSSPLTLNVTRAPMAAMGYCPSGRLFEAAACGTPVLSDGWDGLQTFFEPGREILVARTTEDALAALDLGPEALARVGRRARDRVLAEHSRAGRHLARRPEVHAPDARPGRARGGGRRRRARVPARLEPLADPRVAGAPGGDPRRRAARGVGERGGRLDVRRRGDPGVRAAAHRRAHPGQGAPHPLVQPVRPPARLARDDAAPRGGGLVLLPPLLHGAPARGRHPEARAPPLRRLHARARDLPVVPLRGPAARLGRRVAAQARGAQAADGALVGRQLPARRGRVVRPADARARALRRHGHVLLHAGAPGRAATPARPGTWRSSASSAPG